MQDHIAYAMRNEEATKALIYFNAPSQLLDWTFLAIQAIVITGLILAIVHAVKYKKRTGSNSALLTLLACFLYGITMDTLSYYTVENFWHGEFSVMFLYNKLPLYIACFYPAFMYHTYMTIKRYNFTPLVEAICVGFFSGFLYLIFDNLGPMLGWWIWDTSDATTWPYVDSVPLTSYHWFFTFTIAFSLINRMISWNWLEKNVSKIKIFIAHLLQPIATILLGSLFFIPYNLFSKSAPPYDMLPWAANLEIAALVHVLSFSAAGWLFLMHWKKPIEDRDTLLMVFPFLYLVGHAYMYIAKIDLFFTLDVTKMTNGVAVGNLLAVVLAMIACTWIVVVSHSKKD